MATQKQYEAITKVIIEALKRGVVPWQKPWNAPKGNALPHNAATGHRYKGLNVFNLWAVGALGGYSTQAWVTYKQATQLGGYVRKGESATLVQFWKFEKKRTGEIDEDGEEILKPRFLIKFPRVFNVDQCEGLKLPKRELVSAEIDEDYDAVQAAEHIIESYTGREHQGPAFTTNGGDRAFYSPDKDSIHVPKASQYEGADEYYSTVFHELVHSTGHRSRLKRLDDDAGPSHFGSEKYSKEELVAEFGNAFLSAEVGIDSTIDNSASYINGWLKAIQGDYTLALFAAGKAQKAADHVLSKAGGE
jgi:antirestriction protein ArdC